MVRTAGGADCLRLSPEPMLGYTGRRLTVRTPENSMIPTKTNDNRTFVQFLRKTSLPPGQKTDRRGLQTRFRQSENGSPEDVVLGNLDLIEPEQGDHLPEDEHAGDDRGRPIGVQPGDVAALLHRHRG